MSKFKSGDLFLYRSKYSNAEVIGTVLCTRKYYVRNLDNNSVIEKFIIISTNNVVYEEFELELIIKKYASYSLIG